MKKLQEVFDQFEETKGQLKEIKEEYKDALSNASEYEEIKEKMKELNDKKKQIETLVQKQMGERFQEMEILKDKEKELKQMISDIAVSDIMNGKSIEVKDQQETVYEPKFAVTFKKSSTKNIVS